ncbi:cysteine hydrolase family protein [Gephyromycinifex aptenodytis]|uniref:hypothetical protein n=1 Tax=Gephyromycinifex aptenodytis TaxID=2716227 RepID=UPI00144563AF|nr:hypothetical protein [Gephyromycinifex aptenodytis]
MLVHDLEPRFPAAFYRSNRSQIDLAVARIDQFAAPARRTKAPVIKTEQPPSQGPAEPGRLDTNHVLANDAAVSGRTVLSDREGPGATNTALPADVSICAPGYEPPNSAALLDTDAALLRRDDLGRTLARHDLTATWDVEDTRRLVFMGQSRHQHGRGVLPLRALAARACEIVGALIGTHPEVGRSGSHPSMVSAS